MRVVITGASGLVGRHLNEYLKQQGLETILLSRSENEGFIQTDYSIQSLQNILDEKDSIVHLAAKRSSSHLLSDFYEDITMTQNLYEVAKETKIKNIVFASSISVYSDPAELPWTETSSVKPATAYGITKRTLELLGAKYNRDSDMSIKNVRLAHIFGPNEKNNYMINLFFRKAFNREPISLNTRSTSKREFLYVKDACAAIYKVLQEKSAKGTFNLGSPTRLTNYEVAHAINRIFENKDNLYINDPDKADNVKPSYMSSHLFSQTFDYSNQYSFEEALMEIQKELEGEDYVPSLY